MSECVFYQSDRLGLPGFKPRAWKWRDTAHGLGCQNQNPGALIWWLVLLLKSLKSQEVTEAPPRQRSHTWWPHTLVGCPFLRRFLSTALQYQGREATGHRSSKAVSLWNCSQCWISWPAEMELLRQEPAWVPFCPARMPCEGATLHCETDLQKT